MRLRKAATACARDTRLAWLGSRGPAGKLKRLCNTLVMAERMGRVLPMSHASCNHCSLPQEEEEEAPAPAPKAGGGLFSFLAPKPAAVVEEVGAAAS
jgi:hypothetical protein